MPLFTYKALSANGTGEIGEIEASDRPEALRVLDKRGLQPVNLKESSKPPVRSAKTVKKKEEATEKEDEIPDGPLKLKRAEVILFTEELSLFLLASAWV